MTRSMNYGLKKRPDYDEIQDYLNNKQPKLKFPDRLATFIRRTNQMSNLLDGEGYSLFDLEMQQQKNLMTEQAKTIALIKMRSSTPPTPTRFSALLAPTRSLTPRGSSRLSAARPAQQASAEVGYSPSSAAGESFTREGIFGELITAARADEEAKAKAIAKDIRDLPIDQPSGSSVAHASAAAASSSGPQTYNISGGGTAEERAESEEGEEGGEGVEGGEGEEGVEGEEGEKDNPDGEMGEWAISWLVKKGDKKNREGIKKWSTYDKDMIKWTGGDEKFWNSTAYQYVAAELSTRGAPAKILDNVKNITVRNLVKILIKESYEDKLDKNDKVVISGNIEVLKHKMLTDEQKQINISALFNLYRSKIVPKRKR